MPDIRDLGQVVFNVASPYSEPQNSVVSRSVSHPPAAAQGARYIVAQGGYGAWVGHDGTIATREAAGWSFLTPAEGFSVWVDDEDLQVTYDGIGWVNTHTGARTSPDNKRMVARVTANDGDLACDIAVLARPVTGSYVGVLLNGIRVSELGDGSTADCVGYFSNNDGMTARSWGAVTQGDTFHWNGTVAGFELATTDVLEFEYMVAGG